MKEGLLWFDDDAKRPLREKLGQAARRYQERLQQKPTVCYLNPADFTDAPETLDGIQLKPACYVRPHYLWLGIETPLPAAKAA